MIENLGNIGDLIGGVGVIATLIYLATQIRQNTKSHRMASIQQIVRHEALCLLAAVSAAQEAVTHRTWYRVLGLYGQPCRSSVDREVIGRKPSG